MASASFAELVARLTEAFGQTMGSSRERPEGLLLGTTDGFLYAFVEKPEELSLSACRELLKEAPGGPKRLVVFAPTYLPLALRDALLQEGGTVVDGRRFQDLVRGLDLGEYLGHEPRPARGSEGPRRLPSAQVLDAILLRARSWQDWGVPALSLRFFRQASDLKPEFLPARLGIAASLLGLGLASEAQTAYRAIIASDSTNLEAQIGLAAVRGFTGDSEGEIAEYRRLLRADPNRVTVQAHLVAALAAHRRWTELRGEVESLLSKLPEDPRLRFLRGVALGHMGSKAEGESEKARARELGLTIDSERAMCRELGIDEPAVEKPATPVAAKPRSPSKPRAVRRASAPSAPRRRGAVRSSPARRVAKSAGAARKKSIPSSHRPRKAQKR